MNLIEQLKNNEKPFILNNKEERECFEKAGKGNCNCLAINSTPDAIDWDGGLNLKKNLSFLGGLTYRIKPDYQPDEKPFALCANYRHFDHYIKPDYQPESGVEKCEVDRKNPYRLRYKRKGRVWVFLHEALSDPDLSDFLDEFNTPMRIRGNPGNQGEPAPIPKYVVFRKAKQ